MWKLFIGSLLTVLSFTFAQSDTANVDETKKNNESAASANDIVIVQAILDQCGITDRKASDAAVYENGRAISLDLSNKDITKDGIKTLPADIGKLSGLQTLICKNNSLTSIPSDLFNCSQLKKIDFNSNSITELSLEIGRLSNLIDIDLRYNELESLPYTIGNLQSLRILRLWGNSLKAIGESITTLPALEELYLKDNRIESLPISIIKMKSLKYIDIEGNKLCDVAPQLDTWLKIKNKSYRQGQKCW
jgi:hypothetical protein